MSSTEEVEVTPEPPPVVVTPEPPPVVVTPEPPPIMQETSTPITISEIMYGSEISFSPEQWIEISNTGKISEIMYGSEIRFSPEQWIEISNTGTEVIDLIGWTLTIQNVDSEDLLGPVTATINFRDAAFDDAPRIWPNDFLLIVTSDAHNNSGGFMEDQVYDLTWRENLGISFWDHMAECRRLPHNVDRC